MPKTLYQIKDYRYPDSGNTYYSFFEPDNDTNPDSLPVIELDAAETFRNEADYYSEHGTHIDLSHKQLIELMAELYKV